MSIQIETPMQNEPAMRHDLYIHVWYCNHCDSDFYSLYYLPHSMQKTHWPPRGVKRSADGNFYISKVSPEATSEYVSELHSMSEMHCPVCNSLKDSKYCDRIIVSDEDDCSFRKDFIKNKSEILESCKNGNLYVTNGLRRKWMCELRSMAKYEANKWFKKELFLSPCPVNRLKVKEYCKSNDNIKEYLLQLIHLEMNKQSLESRIVSLNESISICQMYERKEKGLGLMRLNSFHDAIKEAQEEYDDAIEDPIYVPMPAAPQKPVLKKPGLFNKKKVLQENDELTKQYEKEMLLYESTVKKCEEKSKQLTDKAIADAKRKLDNAKRKYNEKQNKEKNQEFTSTKARSMIEKELEDAKKIYIDTNKAIQEMYSLGIVYEKYHDIVAISTFYEYLMSGRCSALEGTDGAYNLYENEIRANIIVSQLSEIIAHLEAIKQNQYMLYSEMQKMNKSIYSLNSQMDDMLSSLEKIENHSKQVEYNTAVTAYYAQKNAEITNALALMVALK